MARDVLFRMPYVIHYSRSLTLTNLMHGQVPATIFETALTNPIEYNIMLLLTRGRDSVNCT